MAIKTNLQTTVVVAGETYQIQYEGELDILLVGPTDTYKKTAVAAVQQDQEANDLIFQADYGAGVTIENLIQRGFRKQ